MNCINPMIPGWMSEEELAWLHYQAMLSSSVVEVGCWKGRSTYALLTGCLGPVYAVDHFKGSPSEIETNHREALNADIHGIFLNNVGWFNNLRVLKMSSLEAAQQFNDQNKKADTVFIDAEHTYEATLADINTWMPLCARMLCGHDLNFKEIKMALRDSIGQYHEGPGSLWYALKGEEF
jgi:hypothetical protein